MDERGGRRKDEGGETARGRKKETHEHDRVLLIELARELVHIAEPAEEAEAAPCSGDETRRKVQVPNQLFAGRVVLDQCLLLDDRAGELEEVLDDLAAGVAPLDVVETGEEEGHGEASLEVGHLDQLLGHAGRVGTGRRGAGWVGARGNGGARSEGASLAGRSEPTTVATDFGCDGGQGRGEHGKMQQREQ